jgi:hypothetical protein
VRTDIYDFTGGLHVELPIRRSRVVPYLAGAAGSAIMHVKTMVGAGQEEVFSGTNRSFAFNCGAGVRLYVGRGWGLRPELKVVHHRIDPMVTEKSYLRASLGVFYRWR